MMWLQKKRQEIDIIDAELADLLKKRFKIVEEIGHYKKENNIPVMQNSRVEEIMKKCEFLAGEKKLDPEFLKKLYKLIINHACRLESEMIPLEDDEKAVVFCTLGPEGTCHSNAVKQFIKFHSIVNAEIVYVNDFEEAVKKMRIGNADYIVQNAAHPQVGLLNEKYRNEIYVNDSFLCPTLSMGILRRKGGNRKRKIGLMPAAVNYINQEDWEELVFETANPIVGEELLHGKYDFGITFTRFALEYPDELELVVDFGGPVDTCWLVYGKEKRNVYGEVLGDKTVKY